MNVQCRGTPNRLQINRCTKRMASVAHTLLVPSEKQLGMQDMYLRSCLLLLPSFVQECHNDARPKMFEHDVEHSLSN